MLYYTPTSSDEGVRVTLKCGVEILVSCKDANIIHEGRWKLAPNGYVRRYSPQTQSYELLHRVIAKPQKGLVVDHINGDILDNRRSNLRVCTQRENMLNRHGMNRNNTSGYRGVCFDMGKWKASIKSPERLIHIGRFDTPEEAARAFDAKAKELRGDKAILNFPD